MKKSKILTRIIPLIVISMLCSRLLGQAHYPQSTNVEPKPSDEPKKEYCYIVVYREWESSWVSDTMGGTTIKYYWHTNICGFEDMESLKKWLNNPGGYWFDSQKRVRLNKNELIGIYDLTTAKKINATIKTEEKTIEKHIEVEKESWIDYEWELKF